MADVPFGPSTRRRHPSRGGCSPGLPDAADAPFGAFPTPRNMPSARPNAMDASSGRSAATPYAQDGDVADVPSTPPGRGGSALRLLSRRQTRLAAGYRHAVHKDGDVADVPVRAPPRHGGQCPSASPKAADTPRSRLPPRRTHKTATRRMRTSGLLPHMADARSAPFGRGGHGLTSLERGGGWPSAFRPTAGHVPVTPIAVPAVISRQAVRPGAHPCGGNRPRREVPSMRARAARSAEPGRRSRRRVRPGAGPYGTGRTPRARPGSTVVRRVFQNPPPRTGIEVAYGH